MSRTSSEVKLIDSFDNVVNPATSDKQLANMVNRVATNSVDSSIAYVGRAKINTLTSEALWQIIRYDESVDEVSKYAGTGVYDQIWDDRESLTYT